MARLLKLKKTEHIVACYHCRRYIIYTKKDLKEEKSLPGIFSVKCPKSRCRETILW